MARLLQTITAPENPRYAVPAKYHKVDAVARAGCVDWETLDGLSAVVDPRRWLAADTAGWTPQMFALSLALAAAATHGAEEISAKWLCTRTGIERSYLGIALRLVGRGPGHPRCELTPTKVLLLSSDTRLLRPDLYCRNLSIEKIANAPDSIAIRGLLLAAEVAARASMEPKTLNYWGSDLVAVLELPGGRKANPIVAMADRRDWIAGFLPTHRVKFEEYPFDDASGEVLGDLGITAAPIDEDRIGWIGARAQRRYRLSDGDLDGISLCLGSYAAAKAWRRVLKRGVASTWGQAKSLWLALLHAATTGVASPLSYFSVETLRELLNEGGVRLAFRAFCEALRVDSGATVAEPRGLRQNVAPPVADGLFAAQVARRDGLIIDAKIEVLDVPGKPMKDHRGRVPAILVGPGLRAGLADAQVPQEARSAILAAAQQIVALEDDAEAKVWKDARSDAGDNSGERGVADCLAHNLTARLPAETKEAAYKALEAVGEERCLTDILGRVFSYAWSAAAERLDFKRKCRVKPGQKSSATARLTAVYEAVEKSAEKAWLSAAFPAFS